MDTRTATREEGSRCHEERTEAAWRGSVRGVVGGEVCGRARHRKKGEKWTLTPYRRGLMIRSGWKGAVSVVGRPGLAVPGELRIGLGLSERRRQ